MIHRTEEKDEQNISQKEDEESPTKANQQVKTNQDTGSQPNPMTKPDINGNEIVQINVNNDQIETTSREGRGGRDNNGKYLLLKQDRSDN